ncbi:putative uncharacterized protein [Parachlamydia acanthamoebae UV-7]|uniref:Uncharacterized protein n=1 Tax=Parachlamydia acanthamoebae (strain UV7) TaxID=765952 RepID=F8KXI1_PARAV|nr:putative uncharacterized protein [Parachlamydia acanthamoebae UV-7]
MQATLVSGPDTSVSLYATDGSITTQVVTAGNTVTLSQSGTFPGGDFEIVATPFNTTTGFSVLDYSVSVNSDSYTFNAITIRAGQSSLTGFPVPYLF